MNQLSTKTIKEIALENPATVRVFQEYKLIFAAAANELSNDVSVIETEARLLLRQ